MEENKNNAIEKTEELSKKPQNSKTNSSKGKSNKKGKRKPTLEKSAKIREQRAEDKRNKKLEKQRLKNEKKKAIMQAKAQKKKAKLHKKEEIAKAKNARLEAKNKKRADAKKLKLHKKEERQKRKELLKHETKQQRRNRIKTEKQQKIAYRREKLQERKDKRLRKLEDKKQKREQKAKERRSKRRERKGYGGWIAAVVTLGSAVLILGSLLTLTFFTPIDDYMGVTTTEEKSFYDLVGYVDNMDVNLSKLIVSNDTEKQQKILGELRVQSNLAVSSISTLSLHDEDKFNTTKFINQIGDYSKYLEEKLIEGESLSSSDKETLKSIYNINNELKYSLQDLASSIDDSFDFRSIYEGKKDNLVISRFIELESNSTNYPHMIYDGAYSDTVNRETSKYLVNFEKVSKAQAEELFRKYFASYNLSDVTLLGETTSEKIECYDFEGVAEDGTVLDAQISKNGGKLVLFAHYKDCSNDVYSSESLEKTASDFLQSVGYKNMKAVWKAEGNHIVTFNFASVVDGVICYSDLVKVNVCMERGIVSGLEASSYLLNHTDRKLGKASISLENAREKVSSEIDVKSSRLAIIPYHVNHEALAYEFVGLNGGETYYIYIDAKTGKELDIFKVVKTTEGTLIM